jgi:hypothetical protein
MRGTSNDEDDFCRPWVLLCWRCVIILWSSVALGILLQSSILYGSSLRVETYASFRRLCQPIESMSVMIIHTASVVKSSLRAIRS